MTNIPYDEALDIIKPLIDRASTVSQESKNFGSALDGLYKTIFDALVTQREHEKYGLESTHTFVDKELLEKSIETLKDKMSSPDAEKLHSSFAKTIGGQIGQVVVDTEHIMETRNPYGAESALELIKSKSDEMITKNRDRVGKIITDAVSKGEELTYALKDNPLNIANYEAKKLLFENDNKSLVGNDSLKELWDSPEIDSTNIFENSGMPSAVGKVGTDGLPDPWGEINTEKLMETKISPPDNNAANTNIAQLSELPSESNSKTEALGKWQSFLKNNQRAIGGAELLAGVGITTVANNKRVAINNELAEKELGGKEINFDDRAKQFTANIATIAGVAVTLDGASRSLTKQGIGHWVGQVTQGVGGAISR
jgi:hypothetical protein